MQHKGSKCIKEYDKYKGVEEMMPYAKAVSAKSYDFDENGNETTIDYIKMLKIVKESKGHAQYVQPPGIGGDRFRSHQGGR